MKKSPLSFVISPKTSKKKDNQSPSSRRPRSLAESWREEILDAKARLEPFLMATPLIFSDFLTETFGISVWLKLESLQPTGSFKVRPAFNSILASREECEVSGLVTSSSGNFAQAVAYAAELLELNAIVVMMKNASRFKRSRTEAYGAHVELCGNTAKARSETVERIHEEDGHHIIHPYNSRESIAGNGVLGLELLEQIDQDFNLIVPVSGGGLISGTALTVKAARPNCRIFGVQPELNPSMRRSLEKGAPVQVKTGKSIADALTVPMPGANTFPIVQQLVEDVFLVNEKSMAESIGLLSLEQKLVVEAGGAASVAALRHFDFENNTMPIVCVISGGNLDPELLTKACRSAHQINKQVFREYKPTR